jgi:hypothetical protein
MNFQIVITTPLFEYLNFDVDSGTGEIVARKGSKQTDMEKGTI